MIEKLTTRFRGTFFGRWMIAIVILRTLIAPPGVSATAVKLLLGPQSPSRDVDHG
jgi:ABC-type Fe3+ transport system permease subunit